MQDRKHTFRSFGAKSSPYIIVTDSIVCGAGLMKLSSVHSSVRPSVRLSVCLSVPSCGRRTPLRRVCSCGHGGQEISIDCCTVAAQRQMRAVPRCQLTHEAEHRLVIEESGADRYCVQQLQLLSNYSIVINVHLLHVAARAIV